MKRYFVTTYEKLNEFAQEDAYLWHQNGNTPEELTDEKILNEFEDWIDENCMELEEAQELAYNSDDFTSYFELHELCEKIREELQEIIDEEKEE